MAKIGVEMELNGLSRSGYFDAVRSGQHNTQGWWDTGTDPDMVRTFFHSSNAGGGTNRNNYINEEMDAMIDAAAAEAEPAARCELYTDIQKKVKDEAIMELWADPVILYAHSNDAVGRRLLSGRQHAVLLYRGNCRVRVSQQTLFSSSRFGGRRDSSLALCQSDVVEKTRSE